jgi:hypothetical protein
MELAVADQLTKDERIRLEALAQAVSQNMGLSVSAENTLDVARRFERYIREGEM